MVGMLSQYVVSLAKATPSIPAYRASLRSCVLATMALTLYICGGCFVSYLPADAKQSTGQGDTRSSRASQARQLQTSPADAWLTAGRPLKFERLSTEQGLSQNTVLCALQDRQGLCGLARRMA